MRVADNILHFPSGNKLKSPTTLNEVQVIASHSRLGPTLNIITRHQLFKHPSQTNNLQNLLLPSFVSKSRKISNISNPLEHRTMRTYIFYNS